MRRMTLVLVAAVALLVGGAQAAGGLDVHLVSQTTNTITLGWTPQPGYGYLFFNKCLSDGTSCTLVSRTNDQTRSTVKFAKGDEVYRVAVITAGNDGLYPAAPPPPPSPQCSDGADNDGDGKIDYPADPGCSSATDNDETDAAPLPQCSDGIDNDSDGKIDYPADPGCSSSTDNDETDPVTGTNANLWVDGGGGSCTRSPAGSPYSSLTACASLNAAYQAAACGDLVRIRTGSYGNQTLAKRAELDSCATDVTMTGAGQSVLFTGSIDLAQSWTTGVSHLTLSDFSIAHSVGMDGNANHITIDRVDGGTVYMDNGANNINILNSDWGPCMSQSGPGGGNCGGDTRFMILDSYKNCGGGACSGQRTHDILIQGNTIHDYDITDPDHWEAIFASGGQNVTIRGNHFYDNELYNIAMGENGYGDFDGWLIENNWFGRSCNNCETGNLRNSAIETGGCCQISNVLIRFNSFADGQTFVNEGNASYSNFRLVGNILGDTDCAAGATYQYNLVRGGTCGTNSLNIGAVPYLNPNPSAAGDYHLAGSPGSTPADNYVSATGPDASLAVDYDGNSRPHDPSGRDAGSDER